MFIIVFQETVVFGSIVARM